MTIRLTGRESSVLTLAYRAPKHFWAKREKVLASLRPEVVEMLFQIWREAGVPLE